MANTAKRKKANTRRASHFIKPKSTRGGLIIFVFMFAAIGGGILLYRSFAASDEPLYTNQILIKLKPEYESAFNDTTARSGKTSIKALEATEQKVKPTKIRRSHDTKNLAKGDPNSRWLTVDLDATVKRIGTKDRGSADDKKLQAALAEYKANPAVEYAELNSTYGTTALPNDKFYTNGEQWSHKKTNIEAAWSTTTGTPSTVIAVLDTGTYTAHEELKSKLWLNNDTKNGIDDDNNGYIDDTNGWNFVSKNAAITDNNGHGSHVAGIAAGATNNSVGAAGVCQACKIMTVKVLDGSGAGDAEGVAQGILYAAENGAHVINLSLSGGVPNQILLDAINFAHSKNMVVVAANGNNSQWGNAPQYPAMFENVIAVGATNSSGQLSAFSTTNGSIDLVAPGEDIVSPWIGSTKTYQYASGTSMATPYVSGVVGLLRSVKPTYNNERIRQALRLGAKDMTSVVGFDPRTGYGIVDANVALQKLTKPVLVPILSSPQVFGISGPNTGIVTIKGGITAYSIGLKSWKLQYGKGDYPTTWTTIASGTTAPAAPDSVLGTVDLANFSSGSYVIRLFATDTNNQTTFTDIHQVR
jgi:subtilisin family serine protease